MVLILLIFLCNVLSRENMCHACSVEKLLCVVQVLIIVNNCYV
jgi:hypothetical protein